MMKKNEIFKNKEGYTNKVAGAAITAVDQPPAEVVRFRKMVKIMCEAGDLRVLGKITIVDKKGRHW